MPEGADGDGFTAPLNNAFEAGPGEGAPELQPVGAAPYGSSPVEGQFIMPEPGRVETEGAEQSAAPGSGQFPQPDPAQPDPAQYGAPGTEQPLPHASGQFPQPDPAQFIGPGGQYAPPGAGYCPPGVQPGGQYFVPGEQPISPVGPYGPPDGGPHNPPTGQYGDPNGLYAPPPGPAGPPADPAPGANGEAGGYPSTPGDASPGPQPESERSDSAIYSWAPPPVSPPPAYQPPPPPTGPAGGQYPSGSWNTSAYQPPNPPAGPPGPPAGPQPPQQQQQQQVQQYQQQPHQPPQPQNPPQPGQGINDLNLLRRTRRAPRSGWRRAVHKVSRGVINPGESAADIVYRDLVERVNQPVRGDYRIAILSLKGGVGKTTTTVGLGSTFASLRGDRVIAIDANPDLGTLAHRVPRQTRSTVRNLLEDQHITRYSDVRAHTSQAPSRLEVLASEQDPAVSEAFSEADYRKAISILQSFYNIILTDCGTGLMHSAMSGVLDMASSLVLVTSPAIDGARSASATLDWLDHHGYGKLVERTVVVVNASRRGSSTINIDNLRKLFLDRTRAVQVVPFDDHLAEGAEIDLELVGKPTRRALLELAAMVADDFAYADGGNGRDNGPQQYGDVPYYR
uniref:MinD/ParA family ATP-binding protein n=2 Tax=Nocardia paucivorans TaxID=114259 RepID=UPI003570B17A